MDTTNHDPPEADNAAAAAENSTGPPPPYQPPTLEELRQDWPLDPEDRAAIVANLVAMTQPGAQFTRTKANGQTVTTTISPRHNCRASKLLNQIGWLDLGQQKQDYNAQVHNGSKTLNDAVNAASDEAGERMTAEAHRRGLQCAAELDPETIRAISDQTDQEYIAKHGPLPQTGPKPLKPTPPEQRNDWVISKDDQRRVMDRLVAMASPRGQVFPTLRLRDRLMATQALIQFCRLVAAQQRFDRHVQARPEPFDWDAWDAWAEEVVRKRIEERRREDAEDEAFET